MPGSKREGKLIALFQSGDKSAFQHIYALHQKSLRYFATKLVLNRQQAEDIVADSYIKLWKLRSNFDTLDNIRAFLFLTTRNACFNFLRQQKRSNAAYTEMLYLLHNDSDLIRFREIEASVLDKVYEEIESLPKQCREVFKLYYLKQLSTMEIAIQMKLSRNTVQNHKVRAIKLLRTILLKKNLLALIILSASFQRLNPNYYAGITGLLGFS